VLVVTVSAASARASGEISYRGRGGVGVGAVVGAVVRAVVVVVVVVVGGRDKKAALFQLALNLNLYLIEGLNQRQKPYGGGLQLV